MYVYMYVCVYVCMYVRVYLYINVRTHVKKPLVHTHATDTHTHTHTYTHTLMPQTLSCVHLWMRVCVNVYMCVHMWTNNSFVHTPQVLFSVHTCISYGWRPIGCLIFIGHFPQKSPTITVSFAENDLQLDYRHCRQSTHTYFMGEGP